ncbi:MAG: hypothetical protein RLZZ01_1705, partial [Actinomycetota bacterium]
DLTGEVERGTGADCVRIRLGWWAQAGDVTDELGHVQML